jgi:hypothetical protein
MSLQHPFEPPLRSIVSIFGVHPLSRFPLTVSSRTSLWYVEQQPTEQSVLYARVHLLNRLCLICLVASASTESNVAIIFTIIPVIIGVSSIFV